MDQDFRKKLINDLEARMRVGEEEAEKIESSWPVEFRREVHGMISEAIMLLRALDWNKPVIPQIQEPFTVLTIVSAMATGQRPSEFLQGSVEAALISEAVEMAMRVAEQQERSTGNGDG